MERDAFKAQVAAILNCDVGDDRVARTVELVDDLAAAGAYPWASVASALFVEMNATMETT